METEVAKMQCLPALHFWAYNIVYLGNLECV